MRCEALPRCRLAVSHARPTPEIRTFVRRALTVVAQAPPSTTSTAYSNTTPAVLEYVRDLTVKEVKASPGARPLVVLPGFGNNTVDYTAPFGDRSLALTTHLERRGYEVFVVDLERKEWLNVAKGLLTPAFWQSKCTAEQGYRWYMDRVHAKVQEAMAATGAAQVDLVGHSAGGWLARAYLADEKYGAGVESNAPNPAVRTLVTLGAPHLAPPKGVPGVFDATRGALDWLNSTYPGAHFRQVRYVTVAGNAVRGVAESDAESKARKQQKLNPSESQYAFGSYQQVCGAGDVMGDCVVPVDYALLDGAEQIVLQGCFHSMSKIGSYEERGEVPWYGADAVVDTWLSLL